MSISGRALFLLSSSALCFIALGSGVALADGSTSGDGIETVLVTAEKRVEDVQKMSSAVTALSGDDLLQRQITSVSDLQRVVPGLVEGDTLGGVQKAETIRGIGTANAMPGGDPGVAVSVDGHYMQDSGFVVRDLLDVSRVEVLRGPQGTLYGRNATGGAINVITNRPTQDFDGYVTAGVGSFGDRNVTGLLNGGLTDDLAGRVAVAWDKSDGYLRNISPIAPQKRLLNTDSINARATLEYDPSQNFRATLSAYGYQNTGNIYAYRLLGDLVAIGGVNFSHLPAGYINPTNDHPYEVRQDTPTASYDRARGASLDLDWTVGGLQLRSLSAYNNSSTKLGIDLDATDATPPVTWSENFRYNTFSQEFQALFSGVNYKAILGVYGYWEDSVFTRQFRSPSAIYGIDYAYAYDPAPTLKSQSYAAFGSVDYNVTDKLTLTAGARLSYDRKSMVRGFEIISQDLGGVISSTVSDDHANWSKFTGRVALRYELTPEANTYASFSTGYKPGGFNAISSNDPAYRPETVKAYEVGFKSQWFDDHLRLNVAAFYNDYKDKQEFVLQLSAPNANSETAIKNAAAATTKGVEFEYVWKATDDLRFDGTASYLYATYGSYNSADTSRPSLGIIDLAGNMLPGAPVWTTDFGAQYDVGLLGGGASVRMDYTWKSSYFSNAFNRSNGPNDFGLTDYVPSQGYLSATVTWVDASSLWEVQLFGRNLTDNAALTYAAPSYAGGTSVNYAAPRTFGVKVTRNF
jgi:iron complex outermembrane receptor protein